MPNNAALPTQESREAIAYREALTFMKTHNYLECPENAVMLNDYLGRRNLDVTYPNLKEAYEYLMESGMLHVTRPDPQPIGGVDPHRPPAKPKIVPYRGSRYDRTEINRLKAQIALMNANEIRECLSVNGWDDWPPFLRS
jgi:hypothetical protein